MLLLIDNYDSFTYNLYQYFCELGAEVKVMRNDRLTLADIENLSPSHLVISPGPCTPDQAGISLQAITHFSGRLPVLGVCLGHQAMAQAFGAKIVRARQAIHGKTSPIRHTGSSVFAGLNNPLTVTRYHSLVIAPDTLPDCLTSPRGLSGKARATKLWASCTRLCRCMAFSSILKVFSANRGISFWIISLRSNRLHSSRKLLT